VYWRSGLQGSYDDSLNKLKAGLQSKDIPAVTQMFDLATQVLIDLNVLTPMQTFIDKDKFDLKDFEQNVLAYYSVDGKLYGMPYNTSNPMLYYNKDAFKAAGLDPAKPPRTYAEVLDAAKKLTKKGADGKVAMYGYSMAIYGCSLNNCLPRRVHTISTTKTVALPVHPKQPSTTRRCRHLEMVERRI